MLNVRSVINYMAAPKKPMSAAVNVNSYTESTNVAKTMPIILANKQRNSNSPLAGERERAGKNVSLDMNTQMAREGSTQVTIARNLDL